MLRRTVNIGALLLCAASLSAAVGLGATWAATAPTPQQRVDATYAAMGGDKLVALKTISFRSNIHQWDPGESFSTADSDTPDVQSSQLVQSRDYVKGLVHNEWVRPRNDTGGTRTFTEIVTPAAGYSIGNDTTAGRLPKRTITGPTGLPEHTFSGRRLTATLRELARVTVIQDMKAHPDRVSAHADIQTAGKNWPAVQYRGDYGTFLVMFDEATNLPARVRSEDWDALEGDSFFDATFDDWRDVAGAKVAFRTRYTLNGMNVADMTLSNVMANPTLTPALFTIPAAQLRTAAKPADPKITPFQWIIRRQYSGFYFDSDTMYVNDGEQMKMMDIAPNVSLAIGNTHNTVFIAMNTYLIALEAPNDDGQAKLAIALAKQRFPGKPIKYLVLSHHHVDHVGGMRTFAAEGATIVFGRGTAPNTQYYRRALNNTQDLNWNKPVMPREPELIDVKDKWTVTDGGREFSAYIIDNPHADGMLMGYLPEAKLGFVTDVWIPTPQPVTESNPGLASVIHGVDKWGLKPEKFSGGHGTIGDYAQAAAVVKAAEARGR